ncbi:MAG: ATP-binding cassette domain-containing protein [Mogibacterium sp.]|nr:ATP-binding cassette domain-containing protein [Mogibacterium sp.]
MGWFKEQIAQRKLADQKTMDDSLLHIASAVLGKRQAGRLSDKHIYTKEAIDEILKYYHCKPASVPEEINDPDEQLEYCLRPNGIMRRSIRLQQGWYRDAMGPMLAFLKDSDTPVALLPGSFYGYSYHDPESGEKIRVNRRTEGQLEEDAICFYRPLPLKEINTSDLIIYLKDCLEPGDYLLLFILSLVITLIGMLMTSITRALTGFVLESSNADLLAGTAAFMISALLASRLIIIGRQLMMDRIGIKTTFALDAAMMMRVMNLPAGFFRGYTSGELASRYNAVGHVCGMMLGNVFSMGLSAILSLLYILQIIRFAPALVVPALLIILTGSVFGAITGLAQMRLSRRIMEKSAKENGVSFSLINGVQKIRLVGAEKRAFAKWAHSYAEEAQLTYNPPVIIRAGKAVTAAISLTGTVILFYSATRNGVTPSEYIAFNTAFGAVTAAFTSLAGVALSVAAIRPVLEMAAPILEAQPESSENRSMVLDLTGDIELSNVSFRYDQDMPYVIKNMDLKIQAGEYIGIVGTTGCGKSTLVRLLLGFETPETGAIYYDGRDLTGLDLRSLRRRIGTVTQNGRLFQGDIFSNIAISAPQMSLEDAWEAAEIAGIADDIRNMPMGMQTQISEGQGGISGGQKQRIMIARAVATRPQILIFDEATSALDNLTQKQISEALDKLECTCIVIAHRLSTIRRCSRILVMDKGMILEEGTYDELIRKNGLFADLISRQRLDA